MYSSIVALCCTFWSIYVNLIGGFKNDFYFPFHIWDNPSHWLIFFRGVETVGNHQPVILLRFIVTEKTQVLQTLIADCFPSVTEIAPRRPSKTSKAIEAEGRREAAMSFDGKKWLLSCELGHPILGPKKPGAGLWKMAIWMIYRYLPIENSDSPLRYVK